MKKFFLLISLIFSLSLVIISDDAIWEDRHSEEKAKKCYEFYKQEFFKSENYETAWKYARAAHFYAINFVQNNELKKKILTDGKDAALKAIKFDDKKPEGHYYLGICYGSWAEANGILKSLMYADDMVDEMTKTINISRNFLNGSPFMVRGRVYHMAPSFPISIGNNKKAKADYEEAIKIGPNNRVAYRFYSEFLIKEKDYNRAKELIDKGLSIPYDPKDKTTEDLEIKLLKELKKQVENK